QQQYLDNQANPEIYINSVLHKINTEPYVYTLNPGVMAADTVDDFWFNKQRGFCEHYSGTFVFLMRAAGIPARVVTGYQGGEMNPYADYMVVRQSDAHAWTEVWLSGKGWVRIDPTGAIHPSRVEVDLSYNWARREALFGDVKPANWGQFSPGLIDSVQLMWDTINNNWQSMIIDFDASAQHDLFADLGFPNLSMSELAKALVVFATMIMMFTALVLLRKRSRLDKVAVSYNKLNRKLSHIGFTRKPTEGPVDYFQRVISRRPDLETQLKPVLQLYLSIRFRESRQTASQIIQFRKRVNSLSLPGKG
ncbi:MAG: transglutaminase domain-containing protein, partial [Gammaproteobacteria bacterium]|nr:transglutaminase domain-containing protein [Gammaproteobacteria bacterium]